MTTERPLQEQHGSVPVPDPTTLTTAQLLREMAALKEVIVTRLDAMDKAVTLLDVQVNRVPTDTDKAVANLKALHDEKFASIGVQFDERDVRIAQASLADKAAIAAALQAAKEAVAEQAKASAQSIDKAETNTAKQIDALVRDREAATRAQETQFGDLKDRVTRIESVGIGRVENRADNRDSTNLILAVVGAVVGVGGLVAGLVIGLR